MENLELIVKTESAVVASNVEEFEKAVAEKINNINTVLETDNDFAEAKKVIKSCKTVEVRLQQALQNILAGSKDITALTTILQRTENSVRSVRLDLNKKVKDEETRRKNEIINAGISRLKNAVSQTAIFDLYHQDIQGIKTAAKNKKTLASLQSAVDSVVEEMVADLLEQEERFNEAISKIEAAEKETPGLFPDKRSLAFTSPDIDLAIESRVAKYRLEMKKKAEREARIAQEKAEREAIAEKAEARPPVDEPVAEEPKKGVPVPPIPEMPIAPLSPKMIEVVVGVEHPGVIDTIKSLDGVAYVK